MEEYILRTINLSKKYKDKLIVDNVNMNIRRGDIYGFIGENGAGKTSVIRLITGLVKITSGNIILFNSDIEENIKTQRKRIGSLIESPALYPEMTAYQNLEAIRLQRGISGKQEIDRVLDLVNLKNTKNKKVKNFSLGMKQKLAIAIALLGDPEFLILDEPINGLDPVSIVEIRELLKKINKDKDTTILISSHILKELNQLATTYGVISNGKLIDEFSSQDLEQRCKLSLDIKVDDINRAVIIIEEQLNTNNFKVIKDNTIKLFDYINQPGKVSSVLVKNNIEIQQIMTNGEDLEDYYVNLIGGCKNV
ncbi:ATP-binding cassette domain-containing protein [Romboutsia lituseburensis]|uniref:ABC-2 type transport system ATP-binding protein n=1 Tax=Romboutsia lituseburensis DSM 797 TaxID=1121325 RepID=A0A1G9URC4_9FIRM|nr:ABC transporter ATP-binding protein [Romboutsia lituseburensis]CEH36153.1 Bacitracin transport ATP-binding protein BcrA [Romboutsia lituseburensis]SDM62442.1 ABC-2 type transport system ATP-binding protein [Romboutsia lituseburensis DSM 797]